jgi:hypothetical protein
MKALSGNYGPGPKRRQPKVHVHGDTHYKNFAYFAPSNSLFAPIFYLGK